jgi:hypothetical protein
MYNAINWPIFYTRFASHCDITLTMYDAADNVVTSDDELVVKRVYDIEVRKLIPGVSSTNILVARTSTLSDVTAETPDQVQRSSTPLSGSYMIKCTDSEGFVSYSKEIAWNTWNEWMNQLTMEGCDMLYDKIETIDTGEIPYKENGVSVFIRFVGLNADPGQYEIVSSETDPLVADDIVLNAETVHPYSSNLFYEPIPFEFLKTYEEAPQLLVEVDGLPAVCHNLDCDFTYIDPVGEVTAFTFDAGTNILVLTGTGLPTAIEDVRKIDFALT